MTSYLCHKYNPQNSHLQRENTSHTYVISTVHRTAYYKENIFWTTYVISTVH